MFVLKEDRKGNRAFFNLSPRPGAVNRVRAIELPLEGPAGESVYLKMPDGSERPVMTRRIGGRRFLGLVKGKPQFEKHSRPHIIYHVGSPIVAVCMSQGVAWVDANWCGRQPGTKFYIA